MSKIKKTIAVDLDDVLALSATGFVAFSNHRWGTNLTVEDYDEHWGDMWQIDHEEVIKRSDVIHNSGLLSSFERFSDAEKVLKQLSKRYTLVIATSRNSATKKESEAWIDKHFQGVFSDFHMSGLFDTFQKNAYKLTKAQLCQEIGADYLIDDQPKHCFAVAEAGIETLLFGDYWWNREVKLPKTGVTRVKNWQDVWDYFHERN